MKTEEGKSMEKTAEEASVDYVKKQGSHDKPDITKHDFCQGFIAGWQEREGEIERLKGLLQETFIDYCIQKYARLDIPLDKDDKEKMWQQFKTENNL